MANKTQRSRAFGGPAQSTQLPGGQWRLRVSWTTGARSTTRFYPTEDTGLGSPGQVASDPPPAGWIISQQAVERPASVAVGGVRCDEWFERWQEAKSARRSLVRVNKKRGGAESTAARDRAYWSKWWAPAIGSMLPHMVTQRDLTGRHRLHGESGASASHHEDALVSRKRHFSGGSPTKTY